VSVVLDASALLALLGREAGAERVARALADRPHMSAVSVAEVATKLADRGVGSDLIRETIEALELEIVAFDADAALASAELRRATVAQGLSLGDRACLGLALTLGRPALTCDAAWSGVELPVSIEVAR